MPKKRRAYLYVRVSALPQIRDLIIEMQLSALRQYALRNNVEIVDIIIDHDYRTMELGPKFREMMETAPKQNINLIIVFSVNKITRNPKEIQEMAEMMNRTGIGIAIVSENLLIDDRNALAFYLHLTAPIAYQTRSEIAKSVWKAKRRHTEDKPIMPRSDEE